MSNHFKESPRKEGTTSYPIVFPLFDSANPYTPLTGKAGSLTATISKNGGAFGAPSGAIAEIGATGFYTLAGHASDRDTIGPCVLKVTDAACNPTSVSFDVVENYDPFVPYQKAAVVDDVGNGAATFLTDLTDAVDDYHNNRWIKFVSGALIGQQQRVSDYNGTTKFISVSSAFTSEPAVGDEFIFLT